jgi:RAB protein geranylgeranyltransferase component A
LYSKSLSVEELIRSGGANYLEFQNVKSNYFYDEKGGFVQIPFSKSEVFSNTFLTFKEKRQLVKVIEACLAGYDKLSQVEMTQAKINSTHIYEKDIELTKDEL